MLLKLPAKVKYILDILHRNGYEAYAVGGCVRDSILARTPDDWDITTSARPEEVKDCFRRTIDTGIQHGTVTVMLEDDGFEVTTYRIDGEYTDGRHPNSVAFTSLLSEDLRRRDFTINAMAYNEEDGLVDLYGGMQDLQKKVIRCVGNPDERFDEDALRILRAVRFAAQLDFSIDEKTEHAVSRHVEHLKLVSAERIQVELVKLLVSKHPEKMQKLYELGITNVILPEFNRCMESPQNTPEQNGTVGEHTIAALRIIPDTKVLRLAMLLHDIGKPETRWTDSTGRDHFTNHESVGAEMANIVLRRLKFDNDTRKQVVNLIRWHELRPEASDASVRHMIYQVGPEAFEDELAVQWSDVMAQSDFQKELRLKEIDAVYTRYQRIIRYHDCLSIRELSVNGRDLTDMGIYGKEVGEILEALLMMVLDEPKNNDKAMLLRCAGELHSQWRERKE